MPTYEYVCEKCGHQFEKVQPMSAKPLLICPEDLCGRKRWGKGKVKRAISGGGGLLFSEWGRRWRAASEWGRWPPAVNCTDVSEWGWRPSSVGEWGLRLPAVI